MSARQLFIGIVLSSLLVSIRSAPAAEPSVERNPFAPAIDQVQARFVAIQGEVDRLVAAGHTAQADALRARLQHFQNQLAGNAPSNGLGSELDIVGVYQGLGGSGTTPGSASVHVRVTDRPVVIALGSHTSVNWTLTLDPGAQLERIILSSYHPSQIVNPPAGVPIVHGDASVHQLDYDGYPAGERLLRSLSGGRPVTSMQGDYQAPPTPFAVGPSNPDWRAQRVLREMHGVYLEATAHQRSVAFNASAATRFDGLLHPTAYAQMSITGAVPGTVRPLPVAMNHFVVTPDQQTGYGARGHEVYRVDMATGQQTHLPVVGPGVPKLSWPCGIAYDTTRQRVVLASLGGKGFLYAYPSSEQWSLMASLDNTDLQSLTYLPSTDTLFGLTNRTGVQGLYQIREYDAASGAFLREWGLGEVIPSTQNAGVEGMHLMTAGDKLALLTPPTPDLYQLDQPDAARLFLIDPSNGAVTYFGVFPAIPEPAMLSAAAAAHFLLQRRRTCR